MTEPFNPYAVSEVNLEPELGPDSRVPANATQRLLATLIDWAFYGIFSAIALLLLTLASLSDRYDPALIAQPLASTAGLLTGAGCIFEKNWRRSDRSGHGRQRC